MNPTTWTIYREYLDRVGEPNAAAALTLADAMQTARDANRVEVSPPPGQPLTVKDVARRLRISPRRAYDLCVQRHIRTFKVGRQIRVRPEDLDAYIADQQKATHDNNDLDILSELRL
jgi:excisionase family DNA binding protein